MLYYTVCLDNQLQINSNCNSCKKWPATICLWHNKLN